MGDIARTTHNSHSHQPPAPHYLSAGKLRMTLLSFGRLAKPKNDNLCREGETGEESVMHAIVQNDTITTLRPAVTTYLVHCVYGVGVHKVSRLLIQLVLIAVCQKHILLKKQKQNMFSTQHIMVRHATINRRRDKFIDNWSNIYWSSHYTHSKAIFLEPMMTRCCALHCNLRYHHIRCLRTLCWVYAKIKYTRLRSTVWYWSVEWALDNIQMIRPIGWCLPNCRTSIPHQIGFASVWCWRGVSVSNYGSSYKSKFVAVLSY